MSEVKRILRVLAHPVDEMYEMKHDGIWPILPAFVIMLMWFAAAVLSELATNFKFNYNHLSEVNILYVLASTVGLLLLFTVVNWAITTLLDGKGRVREIYVSTCYALVPYVSCVLLCVVLSHYLTIEEGAFLTVIRTAGLLYSVLIFISGMSVIHEFGFGKTILCILLSVAGIVFVLFLLVLFFGLMQQAVMFIQTIYTELLIRG